MGTWGTGPLDNDDAADFAVDLSDLSSADAAAAFLGDALRTVAATDEYVEAPEMCRAIAAAVVVGHLARKHLPAPAIPGSWLSSIALVPSSALQSDAAAVLALAFDGDVEQNEWVELWQDAGLLEEGQDKLRPYRDALSA